MHIIGLYNNIIENHSGADTTVTSKIQTSLLTMSAAKATVTFAAGCKFLAYYEVNDSLTKLFFFFISFRHKIQQQQALVQGLVVVFSGSQSLFPLS